MYIIFMSPTVHEAKSLKFKIYFRDHNPPHVHVEGRGAEAVFELSSCKCIENNGFSLQAINKIEKLIREKKERFLEAWNDYQK